MRLALKECAASPLTRMVQGNGHDLRAVGRALAGDGVARVAGARPAELDDPGAHGGDDGDLLGQHGRHLALVVGAAAVGHGQGDARRIHARHRAHHPELHHAARPPDRPACRRAPAASDSASLRPAAVVAHRQQVDELDARADREDREVDDDVVALGDALLVERRQRDRVDDEVAVVGDELERHRRAVVAERQLEEARHAGIQDAEAVLARQHLEVGRVGEVDERQVAQEPVGGEDVEEVLAVLGRWRRRRAPG